MRVAVRNFDVETFMVTINESYPDRFFSYDELDYDVDISGKMDKALSGFMKSVGVDKLDGLKWGVIGDSISTLGYAAQGQEYPGKISTENNMRLNNLAIPGSMITKTNVAGHLTDHMSDRVDILDNDCDVITMAGGVNDRRNRVAIGVMGDTENSTFYGALDVLCRKLIAKFPGKPKAFFTPIKFRGNNTELLPYVNAIKEVAAKYGIPVLDLFNLCDLQPDIDSINASYFNNADGLHPNVEGHKILARIVENFLRNLV